MYVGVVGAAGLGHYPATMRGRFVIHQHAGRAPGFTLRLEVGGVLWSWAVPRGPSRDPADRRMAIRVADAPLAVLDDEGGAIAWDRGDYLAELEMVEGARTGKLLFDLHGIKLRGRYTLVRTGKRGEDGRSWLLIKERDAHVDPRSTRPLDDRSVLSGLRLAELGEAAALGADLIARAAALGPPRGAVAVTALEPMLAESHDRPFSGDGWLFELKYDGYRLLAGRRGDEVALRYRSGRDVTGRFPEIVAALRALPVADLVIDGEVVVLDERGRSDFGRMQKRAAPAEAGESTDPVALIAFDLLALGDRDLRGLPVEQRKELLRALVPAAGIIRYADHVIARGEDFYRALVARDLEGMVAKRLGSPYRAGRSPDWRKVRRSHTAEFAVVGWTRPRGARTGFGGLHLAVRRGEGWRYAGKVGSGFSEAELSAIHEVLLASPPARYPFKGLPGEPSVWVEPRVVVEVEYKQWNLHLRAPVFVRRRADRSPDDCVDPHAPPPRAIAFGNLDKVFWPHDGLTKGDLLEYYRAVAPFLLPYLADRPLVLTRYPDGIAGKSFYQKQVPPHAPSWLRTVAVWSERAGREVRYAVADDLDALLYLVNSGAIPLHLWPSRAATIGRPDWCVLDLDPKGAPRADVVALALAIRALTEAVGLPSYAKTSGQSGLHILLPLGRALTFEQSTQLAGLLAGAIERERGDIATTERTIGKRRGKVYLDWLQNRHGQLLVAPLAVRAIAGAPVSMPLAWDEVPEHDPAAFTVKTALSRLERCGDPLRPVLTEVPDLISALRRLGERVAGRK